MAKTIFANIICCFALGYSYVSVIATIEANGTHKAKQYQHDLERHKESEKDEMRQKLDEAVSTN
jgi:hypothetical protein